MNPTRTALTLSTAPYVKEGTSTPRIMLEVTAAAVAVLLVAVWTFGVSALLVTAAAVLGAVGTEWVFARDKAVLRDFSALLTGLLLGLTLPPAFPLWMAFLGGVVGVALGKLAFGGLGQNLFNPALVGRAFLQSAFPTAITTWSAPAALGTLHPALFAAPMMKSSVDVVSTATPLGLAKFEREITDVVPLLLGNTAGSIGETSALLLLVLGLVLGWRRLFDWRLPVSMLLATALFSTALWLALPDKAPPPWFALTSGGLLFAAVFMATDPVTTPTTPRGAWIFGVGVALLVVLIRVFGGLPEGVMYAILLMNAATPHINTFTRPRPFGARNGR